MQNSATHAQNTIAIHMRAITHAARASLPALLDATHEQKNIALRHAASHLTAHTTDILRANAQDMEAARNKGLSDAMLDRLKLDDARIASIAQGLDSIATLPDPVGRELARWQRPNGLDIARVAVPLGVIGIIYESRPNVTADAGALCLKSGNAAILRGGSESHYSSMAIVASLHAGLREAGLPESAIQLVPTTAREVVAYMLNAVGEIDILVPRGGKSLTERVAKESRIPTIQHLEGNCHSYIHAGADAAMAASIIHNAKLRRTGVCGATESVLVDAHALHLLQPTLQKLLEHGCEVRADATIQALDARILTATEEDYATEYLAPVISMKTVEGLEQAIAHINQYGSHHTDCIITQDADAAARFLNAVDSAIVVHNTSTQFADGGEFGMGAEIGISTGRLHARGPVGCEQLTTFKYVVRGNGQVRGG